MIILHANHRDNGLLLWGEQPANEGGGSPARRGWGRKPKIPRPVAYPFGLEAKDGRYRARWDPAFAGADADHLAALARGMPPVPSRNSRYRTAS